MTSGQDYYSRPEVSNSDLTALKHLLHPSLDRVRQEDREAAFRFGTLVDALVTEPERADYYRHTIDEAAYTEEEWEHGVACLGALRAEARRDAFLDRVLREAEGQKVSVAKRDFSLDGFSWRMDCRCKWDWWLPAFGFGGDLKTTAATSQAEFDEAVDFFDWDRSRAWYMDIAGSDRDFVYGVSKKTGRVFKHFTTRDGETYRRGREKYMDLAFEWHILFGQL